MKIYHAAIVIFLLLSSCSPSPESIQQALTKTQIARATTTVVPQNNNLAIIDSLSELNLAPILVQENELPSGVTKGQIEKVTNKQFEFLIDKGINNINLQFLENDELMGGVTVFLYDKTDKVTNSYSRILSDNDTYCHSVDTTCDFGSNIEVGESSSYNTWQFDKYQGEELVFTRCFAVVDIRFGDTKDYNSLKSYAEKLDKRLSDLICIYNQ